MGFLNDYLSNEDKEQNKNEENLDHLDWWQQLLVKKGEYDKSGFEEEEIEDDDWHSEDEKESI